MNPRRWSLGLLLAVVALLGQPRPAGAHVGNPTTIYEGLAGNIPVRVSVKVPTVVPGLAEINVRVLTNGVTRVTALPAHWQSGPEGLPPADVCQPVPGEPDLYHAELWLMVRGAYSVQVTVETAHGSGKVLVPVNALATTVLTMPRGLGAVLVVLGLLLFALAVSAAGAALRESVLEPGTNPTRKRVWLGRGAAVLAAVVLSAGLWGGWRWWRAEDSHYRNNRMHKPAQARAEVKEEGGRRTLQFNVLPPDAQPGSRGRLAGLVPDHGKLMHLFLVRAGDGAGFAHLHPLRRSTNLFESLLPPLPAGRYHIYADVTHETGFSQTLTSSVVLAEAAPPAGGRIEWSDPEDSWIRQDQVTPGAAPLGDGYTMTWERDPALRARRETTLRFRVLDPQGQPADLEPYMSMLAHAIVWRDDGAVFTHLHPAGTVSVASQQVFQLRTDGQRPRRITPEMMEALCQPPGPELRRLPIQFPYEFPLAGRYRIWVQIKTGGAVRTGVFEAEVGG